jgi:ribosomal protein S18 acetylase RimI-like enzyme
MAARSEALYPQLLELPSVTIEEFDPLLEEEIRTWRQSFDWDFRPSAELLRRFLQIRSLCGYALRVDRTLIAYAYHVCEGRKGLIGDFYLRREFAEPANELMILGAIVQGLMLAPGIQRIECQLLLMHVASNQTLPFQRFLKRYDRYFMRVTADAIAALEPKNPSLRVGFLPWSDRFSEETAQLVTGAYRGHIDSEINDQYRTIPGARHFLTNIIQFPGCGHFSAKASLVAVDATTGRICGVCLASLVSNTSGHITQLCILPGVRGARLGYELIRQSLVRLTELGCNSVSLTVTCSNVEAVRLYESIGFSSLGVLPALVWEGF